MATSVTRVDPRKCACPYPFHGKWRERWTCPHCGTAYVLTRNIPERWWRNWYAPDGHWIPARPWSLGRSSPK